MSNPTGARVLITGATGFVGRHLCPWLAGLGWRVAAGVRADGPLPDGASDVCHLGDLAQRPPLTEALRGIDSIVHLAGRAHVMHDQAHDPEQAFFAANTTATEHLASAAASAGVRRLVFISSIKVNGEHTTEGQPFRASDTPAPEDAYGRSKLAAEQTLHRIGATTGLEIVIIRPPLLHGPGVKGNLPRLMRLIDLGLPLPFAAIDNQRSLLAVANLCDLIAHCLHHPAASGATWLAADADLSTPALIRALASGLERPARLFPLPQVALQGLAWLSGQRATLARLTGSLQIDSLPLRQQLDWTPPLTAEVSLQQTAARYRAARHAL